MLRLTPAIPSSKLNIGMNQWLFQGKVAVFVAQTPSAEAFLITSARQGAQRGGNYINMGNCLQFSNLANVTRRPGCHVWWAVEVHLLMIELLNLWYYARCVLIQHRLTYRAIAAAAIVPIVSVKSKRTVLGKVTFKVMHYNIMLLPKKVTNYAS